MALSSRRLKFEPIADDLRMEIQTRLREGDVLPSEASLAKRYDVSVRVVREAIQALCVEGLVARHMGKGAVVLDPFLRKNVAIVVEPDIADPLAPWFWLRVAQQLRRSIADGGFHCRLYVGHTPWHISHPETLTCAEFHRDVENNLICGIATVATITREIWWRRASEKGIPLIGDHPMYPYSVLVQDQEMVEQGIRWLRQAGCRSVGLVDRGSDEGGCHHERWAQKAAAETSMDLVWSHAIPPCANRYETFRRLKERFSSRPLPDGLLVANDTVYGEVAFVLRLLGLRVPEDLAVVAHQNRGNRCDIEFPIARLENDPDEMAAMMARKLIRLMRHEPASDPSETLPMRLCAPDMPEPSADASSAQ